jgi:hypothetical protein
MGVKSKLTQNHSGAETCRKIGSELAKCFRATQVNRDVCISFAQAYVSYRTLISSKRLHLHLTAITTN